MRVGIVKHVNARPLTLYFEENQAFEGVYDHPSQLIQDLLVRKVDFALVSSIEVLRHSDQLDFFSEVGVFAGKKVRSILFFRNSTEKFPPETVYTDSGSRTSVALLQCLFHLSFKTIPKVVSLPAAEIEKLLNSGKGSHMLFGDHALLSKTDSKIFETIDLASWWFEKTELYFAFAFWAYPRQAKLDPSIFKQALDYGKKNLTRIIEKEARFPKETLEVYFTQELIFETNPLVKAGFKKFSELCEELGLLHDSLPKTF